MSTALTLPGNSAAIEQALIMGDLSKLNVNERLSYYKSVCDSVGLNPLTKPFEYIMLNGKLVLYAKRDATEQLRKIHGVSVHKLESHRIEDVYVVTAYVRDKTGREDSSTGAVSIGAAKGDNLANALMKAETKAKRRATLSICGLGILDETEISTIPTAKLVPTMEEMKAGADAYEKEERSAMILEKVERATIEVPPIPKPQVLPPADKTKFVTISQAQDKRMFAIGKSNGWNEQDIRNVIGRYGFEHPSEVTRNKYEAICDELGQKKSLGISESDTDAVMRGEL